MNQRYHVLFAMFTILLSVQWQPAICSEDDLSKLEEKTNKLKELLKLKELMRRVYGNNGDFDGHNYESVLNEYLQQEQNNKNDDNLNVYNEDESAINNVQDVDNEPANVSDDDGGAQSEQEKRSAYLRFGKRNPAYLRFGRSQAYLRFGKRAPSAYLRFGKRNPAYLRFGRSVEHNQPAAAASAAAEQPKSAN